MSISSNRGHFEGPPKIFKFKLIFCILFEKSHYFLNRRYWYKIKEGTWRNSDLLRKKKLSNSVIFKIALTLKRKTVEGLTGKAEKFSMQSA